MILSVVVLSYNRPDQLKRILDNLVGMHSSDLEIVIKDDRSPRYEEIYDIVKKYENVLEVYLRLHVNESNLGYDLNLLDSFNIVDSDYVFLLSDDDYLDGSQIFNLLSVVARKQYSVYFTPYYANGIWNRSSEYKLESDNFSRIIYDSILFSGLIFNVDSVRKLEKDFDFLSGCIYSQVYLATMLIFLDGCFGHCPEGVLYLGGDGENFFGKNQSSKNSSLLSDRDRVTANLDYQIFLINVVNLIANKTSPIVFQSFYREYKKRLVGYAMSVRGSGVGAYKEFLNHYKTYGPHTGRISKFMLNVVLFVPSPLASKINQFGVKFLRKSG
jgi:hypothetical protein